MRQQWHNLTTLLTYSNITPFKDRNDAGYVCAYCFKTFPDPNLLRHHTHYDHAKEKPTYKIGSGMSSFVAFLDIVDLKCNICDLPMESINSLSEHLVKEHDKKYYLGITDYFQPFKLSMEQQISCCLCPDVFHNMKLLMQHMNVHYRNFICTICGAGFVNSFRLNRHETTHGKKKSSFPCKHCGMIFAAESKKKAHVNTEHKGIAGDSVCQICKARFKNYYQKTRHMMQEHKVEGIKCDKCDKKFNLKSNLMLHIRSVHLKERPYECSVCSMGFFIKRHMLGHYMATHTNERRFKCDVCGKAYATQNSRRKHMKKNHGICKNNMMVQNAPKSGKSNLKVEVVVKQEPVSDNDEDLMAYDPKNPVKKEPGTPPADVIAHGSNQARVKPVPIIKKRYMSDKTTKSDGAAELVKHLKNIRTIMLHSTATPIRHYDGEGYVCMLCPKLYPTVPDLKEHVLEEHDEIDKSSCMEGYTSRNFLVKLDITDLYCLICYNQIDSLESLMDHLATEHKKVIHTDIPNHILPFKFADNKFNCLYCPKVFEHFKHVQEHMNVHYTNYVCDICNDTFVNKQLLNRHALKHRTGEFKCSQCPKIYSTNRKRLDHEKFVHNDGLSKRNKCPHCDARFSTYAKKRAHMVEEHGVEPLSIKCEYCNRTFNTKARWYNHNKRNHTELKHPCNHCDLKFSTKVDLDRHMETHASVKEYKCDVCHKAYSRMYTLRNHMNIHENVRDYKCEYCSSSFVQKWTWKVHMKNIHKIIVT